MAFLLRRKYPVFALPIILLGPYSDALLAAMSPVFNDYVFTPPKACPRTA